MKHIKDAHAVLRDQILGADAKRVIDAEFRELPSTAVAKRSRSPIAALIAWSRRLFSGHTPAFGNSSARWRELKYPRP